MKSISIVVPIWNEIANIPVFYDRLCKVMEAEKLDWEMIAVDDRSSDGSFELLSEMASRHKTLKVVRLARNFGSHPAIFCGLQYATKEAALIMAADLQDPPEVIPELIEKRDAGAKIVWAGRNVREGLSFFDLFFAESFHKLFRLMVGANKLPPQGADFVLIDRLVIDAIGQFREINTNFMALISWLDFDQASITYTKAARLSGETGWSFSRKIKLAVDSIVGFTYLPIRLMSFLGFFTALVGFMYAGVVLYNYLTGSPPEGWSSVMTAVLVIGGVQMLMLGVLGEYLWRALDEIRRRPRFLVEEELNTGEVKPTPKRSKIKKS